MFDRRNGLPYAALLLALAVPFGLSGGVLAQSGMGSYAGGPALELAQYSSTVLELQRELNRLGFDAGPVDGLMGGRTRTAIQTYQRDHQLLVDGQPTSSLLSHVRASAQSRTPAPAAVTPSRSGLSSQQVADIQTALRSLDYSVGRASGRLDDETRAAIRSYESDNGLLMSGEPSAELLRHMRERVGAAPAPSSSPTTVDANTLARIQAELRTRGYPIPLISGRMDAPTRQAIGEYQQGQGVAVTGEPSEALLEALRIGSADLAPAVALSRDQRAAAQRALNARGYDAGPPDGVLGPRSHVAIRSFQAANNIGQSGELDASTLERLGVTVAAAAQPLAAQPAAQDYRVRVRDDFSDGEHTRNPAWRIASGRLEVRNGGLNSVVTPPAARPQDVGRQLLEELIKQQLGGEGRAQDDATAAVAYLPVRGIASVFRITMEISGSAEPYSHIDLGPYRGNGLNYGYRLSNRSNQPLQLVFTDERGTSVIATAQVRLANNVPQQLVWTRDADGRMTVSRDDEVLIDVVDRKLTDGFDGFSLINAGGEWTLHEVIVEDRR